ncbi:MAG: CocE/NonD family hydrolase [Chloroflexi bacterium]|nr:CocE/NonD family hydrolase [Chloroflexota bacterium]
MTSFSIRLDRGVRARMRDGVEIGTVIVRPDSDGQFPAIVAYNPYRTLTSVKSEYCDAEYNHRWDGPSWFAEHGYAVVYFDVRGTGNSGGSTQSIYSATEQRDAYEMVEWIARQPWCDGNVGMWGMSYGGVVQWQVGTQKPPHLKALVVGSSNDTVYGDWVYPGGSIRPYMFDTFSPLMTADNFAPPDPEIVGERWAEMWQERLDNNVPWGIDWIRHPLDDGFYTSRSLQPDYSRIAVPTMLWSGWADCYPTPILRAFANLSAPKRAFIGPWDHDWPEMAVPGPRIEFRSEMLKWFDRWLKGIDNGVTDEPPLNLYVRTWSAPRELARMMDEGRWQAETEWPPARMQPITMYLGNDGALAAGVPPAPAQSSYEYDPTVGITSGIYWGGGVIPWAMPLDQRADELKSLTYTSAPFETDTEVTGGPEVVLYVSSTAESGYMHVKLCDVAPDGTSKWLTDGGLLLSHRASHTRPEAVVPDTIYELRIKLKYVAYIVPAGHAMRLSVASADFQNAWPAGAPAVHTLHRGRTHPSHIRLPLAPDNAPRLPPPRLSPSPRREPTDMDYTGATHTITHDMVNDSVTVELERLSGALPNSRTERAAFGQSRAQREARSRYTVSRKNPANAHMRAEHVYTIHRPEHEIRIEANESLVSDTDCFRFQSRVEIQVDGKTHFVKSWRASRIRMLD